MQLNFITSDQLVELLHDSTILDTIDNGPQRVYVLHYSGSDILAVWDPITGGATVIYGPETFDAESGGSVHDHARQVRQEAEALQA